MKLLQLLALLAVSSTAHAQPYQPGSLPTTPVTFRVKDFRCNLTVFGRPFGFVELNQPKVIPLAIGREHLVECTSLDSPPVKLYARYHVFVTPGQKQDIELIPVAVLPNVVKAVAAGGIVATTVNEAVPFECKRSPQAASASIWDREKGDLVAVSGRPSIPKGTEVKLSATRPDFCSDTNLVEVTSSSGSSWYRNQDFSFSYNGKPILLYPPSQRGPCCWIE